MKLKEILEKIKGFISAKKEKFKSLKKEKKIIIIVGVIAIILAGVFAIGYTKQNKFKLLYSGLDNKDAAAITKELESKSVETKIEGDSIYVPKEQVDKLRIELSSNISNGSVGFELMDQGSSFGMTDEEFEIKKLRMLQGEVEKSIKTFPQVESARVNMTPGKESVFAKESEPGSAAVYINLKAGEEIDSNQVRSIMSLVSASTSNIPKQNVEVVDQYMNLLSEGLFDEDGKINSKEGSALDVARKAEKDLNKELETSVKTLLEPIFGKGKVKVSVNADLNFDSKEKTELVVDPNKVIKSETKSENTTTDSGKTGGAVDNNMNNTKDNTNSKTTSKEEKTDYNTGKVETKTIKAQGELNRVTASVAINGQLSRVVTNNVEKMVSDAIGFQEGRGDSVSVVAMEFNANGMTEEEMAAKKEKEEANNILKTIGYVVGALLILIAIALGIMFAMKKKAKNKENMFDEDSELDVLNQKLEEIEKNRLQYIEDSEETLTLEEEVKIYASENPEQVRDLIKNWLNE